MWIEKKSHYNLRCGTVQVELKLRFTGYRLRFTLSGYGLKRHVSEVFKFLQKLLLYVIDYQKTQHKKTQHKKTQHRKLNTRKLNTRKLNTENSTHFKPSIIVIYIIHVYSLLVLLIIYAIDTIFLECLCLRLDFFYRFVSWFGPM